MTTATLITLAVGVALAVYLTRSTRRHANAAQSAVQMTRRAWPRTTEPTGRPFTWRLTGRDEPFPGVITFTPITAFGYQLQFMIFQPGATFPAHQHDGHSQTIIVLRGTISFFYGATCPCELHAPACPCTRKDLTAGDYSHPESMIGWAAPGIYHAATAGAEPAEVLIITRPPLPVVPIPE